MKLLGLQSVPSRKDFVSLMLYFPWGFETSHLLFY